MRRPEKSSQRRTRILTALRVGKISADPKKLPAEIQYWNSVPPRPVEPGRKVLQNKVEVRDTRVTPSRSMDSKRGPMRTKPGSPAARGDGKKC